MWGFKYIYLVSVIYRDLKLSNLLFNVNCDFKICDFGFARLIVENDYMIEYVVIRWYRASEFLFNFFDYTVVIDVWFVGCLFMEFMNRRFLFLGKDYVN